MPAPEKSRRRRGRRRPRRLPDEEEIEVRVPHDPAEMTPRERWAKAAQILVVVYIAILVTWWWKSTPKDAVLPASWDDFWLTHSLWLFLVVLVALIAHKGNNDYRKRQATPEARSGTSGTGGGTRKRRKQSKTSS